MRGKPLVVRVPFGCGASFGSGAPPLSSRAARTSHPKDDGTLVPDVVIGDYERPWNAKPGKRVAEVIPPAPLWASDPGGIVQIGYIYTAQGFEFDYFGVIFGPDLRYALDLNRWVGFPKESYNPAVKRHEEQFVELVKNVYRMLLSRGLKGCYVYFMDKDTERFVRSPMEVR